MKTHIDEKVNKLLIEDIIVKPRKSGILQRIFRKVGSRYDIKIFEDLPLYVKINVIENCRIMDNSFHSVSQMEMTRRKWLETRGQIPVKA
jgi:hypothetical protein